MSQLTFYLPPFTSDYSGACSCLFDLNCMVVLYDAQCCTRNYACYDEPRWYGNKRPIFCSALREIDAVMGDDNKLICKIKKALEGMESPDFIALLGSPVPTVIGADMQGIAYELEAQTGIPTLGLNTTGLRYYPSGISEVTNALLDRFTSCIVKSDRNAVNILGLTPIDYSDNDNAANIITVLESGGFNVQCSMMMNTSFPQLKKASEAGSNLVVSASGLPTAEYMKEKWGIPYVAATPIGMDTSIITLLHEALNEEGNHLTPTYAGNGGLLIIGDQVISNSIRARLIQLGVQNVVVGTFFGLKKEISAPFDIDIQSEKHLIRIITSGGFSAIMGDPLLQTVPEIAALPFYEIPHVAVSSNLYWHKYCTFVGPEMEKRLTEIAKQMSSILCSL